MKMKNWIAVTLTLAMLLSLQAVAGATVPTVTQTIPLAPGWNAVYLEVMPASNSPSEIFKDLPAGSSVWAWTGKDDSVQFIQDPSETTVTNSKWLAIFASAKESALNNLFAIKANNAYLIQLAGSQPLTLNVSGRPTMRNREWIPDAFNLVGFGFTATPPTFGAFFAPSASHKNQAIYRLNNTSGSWEIVNNPATTAMRSGEAFWIYCQAGSDYQGPFVVEADGSDGLDFGSGITILTLTIRNNSSADKSVAVTQLSAASPVSLSYRSYDVTSGLIRSLPLSGLAPITVKAGGVAPLTLVVNRGSFSGDGASVLEFSDAQGNRVRVPIVATSRAITGYPGLWTGVATLNRVSQLVESATTSPFAPGEARTTPAPLNLNLILHQDASGQVRLLKQAIVMYQDPVLNSDGSVRTKGRYVVLTRDDLTGNYSGVTQRDNAKVGRRLSAIGIDFSPSGDATHGTDYNDTALKCAGSISTTIECRPFLESSASYTHPTNPFLHRYHPDHDNLASDFKAFSREVNRISRIITLAFDSVPKENPTNPPPGWGVTVMGGSYTELINGLARGGIKVEGTFTIYLATDVDTLNQ